jgi:hypothetical protein
LLSEDRGDNFRFELEFVPRAIAMAEALRLASRAAHGWPRGARRALAELLYLFDTWTVAWGWQEVVGPEAPTVISDRLAKFRETYDRPQCEALLSWYEGGGIARLNCSDPLVMARARALGCKPTMTAMEAHSRYPKLMAARRAAPLFGRCRPACSAADAERWRKVVQSIWEIAAEIDVEKLAAQFPSGEGESKSEPDACPLTHEAPSIEGKSRGRRDRGLAMRAYGAFVSHIEALRDGRTTDPPPTPKQLATMIGCSVATASRATKQLRQTYEGRRSGADVVR